MSKKLRGKSHSYWGVHKSASIAQHLAAEGAPSFNTRPAAGADRVVAEITGNVEGHRGPGRPAKEADIRRLFADAKSRVGRLDVPTMPCSASSPLGM